MILLEEVAQTIEKILNGESEYSSDIITDSNYNFVVKTNGLHFDSVVDRKARKNFIPCFVEYINGTFNPIPDFEMSNAEINIIIYFPISQKQYFRKYSCLFPKIFVGKMIYFGEETGKCVCNINVPTVVEMQQFDTTAFSTYIKQNYQRDLHITETWGMLSFTLSLGSCKDGVFGNDLKISMTYDYKDGEDNIVNTSVVRTNSMDFKAVIDSGVEQLLNRELQSRGLPTTTTTGDGFEVYIDKNGKNLLYWRNIIKDIIKGQIQDKIIKIDLESEFLGEKITDYRYIDSASMSFEKGSPLSIVFAFAKRKVNF